MITYNDIYEASRKERYSEQLQKVPKNFLEEITGYLNEKKEMIAKEGGEFSDIVTKTKKQLENAVTLFKEFMVRRRKKILHLVLIAAETGISKQDFENMIDFEKYLFEDLMKCIEVSDKQIVETLNGKPIVVEKGEMIVFKEDVQEFMGLDGKKLGPFTKGQEVSLPLEIIGILESDGKIEIKG